MNKKLISAAVLLGLSSTASAVNINSEGTGQVLLYPYYTTNNGKTTNVHVVNTTGQYKAVKVRFSEGVNTWEVLDFNLYLSPYDVWAGGLSQNEDGTPVLYTPDTSCTVPAFPADGKVALRSGNIDTYTDGAQKTSLSTADRLTEGHVEIIEMGNIIHPTLFAPKSDEKAEASKIRAAIKHDAKGVPGDCAYLATKWESSAFGDWGTGANSFNYMTTPTGGLFGSANIIDVKNGIDRGYDAIAVDNMFTGTVHSYPGNSYPNLNGDYARASGIIGNNGSDTAEIYSKASRQIESIQFARPVDALSAVLATTSISNQYFADANLNASTDWVISFPTKHFYVNKNTALDTDTGLANLTSGQWGFATYDEGKKKWTYAAPFTAGYPVAVGVKHFGREEEETTAKLDFSPSIGAKADSLPYEVNVLEFSSKHNVMASKLNNTIVAPYKAGWARLGFSNYRKGAGQIVSKDGKKIVLGYPAIGFSSIQFENGTLEGGKTLANYASLYNHVYNRGNVISS